MWRIDGGLQPSSGKLMSGSAEPTADFGKGAIPLLKFDDVMSVSRLDKPENRMGFAA
jgi:hypothetical protein